MKLKTFLIVVAILGLGTFTLISISAEESLIPSWIKNTAKFWAEGNASDNEFINAITWMIDNKILKVSQQTTVNEEYFEEYKGWANSEITKFQDYSNKLRKENENLRENNNGLEKDVSYWKENYLDLAEKHNEYVDEVKEYAGELKESFKESYPKATISEQTVKWEFYDSQDNFYVWTLPIESYEALIRAAEPISTFRFEMDDGSIVTVRDHTKFVRQSFKDVINELYEKAGSDERFIFEVWNIVSQLTIYSTDIGEDPRWAVETFTRGGGDCEDTAILMADMLKSSSYAKNWKIQLFYFDSDNPSRAKNVNHVAVNIETPEITTTIETTAKDIDSANAWNGMEISGWFKDV